MPTEPRGRLPGHFVEKNAHDTDISMGIILMRLVVGQVLSQSPNLGHPCLQ